MRAKIQLLDDKGKILQTIEVPDVAKGLRWWAQRYKLEVTSGTERVCLTGFSFEPFLERCDTRSPEEIDAANTEGGFGAQRAKAMGIPHAATEAETKKVAEERERLGGRDLTDLEHAAVIGDRAAAQELAILNRQVRKALGQEDSDA